MEPSDRTHAIALTAARAAPGRPARLGLGLGLGLAFLLELICMRFVFVPVLLIVTVVGLVVARHDVSQGLRARTRRMLVTALILSAVAPIDVLPVNRPGPPRILPVSAGFAPPVDRETWHIGCIIHGVPPGWVLVW